MAKTRTLVCFGDSNTYGSTPSLARGGGRRYAVERRWPGVLRKRLGVAWEVVEEGQPGRTTVRDDPIDGVHKSGLRALPICLESHMPIDVVIIMLGTNDLKHRFAATAGDIADSIEVLVRAVKRSEAGPAGSAPAVLVVSPAPIQEVDRLGEMFRGGSEKSRRFGELIGDVARRCNVAFLDAGKIVESSAVDGIHLDSEAHRALGLALARIVETMFSS
jgi:lysophospholipase L1-like esterase